MRRTVTIKFVRIVVGGSGKSYAWYRRVIAGKPLHLRMRAAPGDTTALAAEAREITERLDEDGIASTWPRGTLGALIDAYRASPQFLDLAAETKGTYERAFAVLAPGYGVQIGSLTRPAILRLRDTVWLPKHKIWLANYTATVMSILLGYAHDHGLIRENPLATPVRRLRQPKDRPPANRPWTADERDLVMREAPAAIRLPLALAMCTGLRRTDIFQMTLAAIGPDGVRIRTSKRGRSINVPIHAWLRDALDRRPKSDSVLVCVRPGGKPLTKSGFDTLWQRFRTRMEREGRVAKGLTLHGLRHTLGTMLKEEGLSDGAIADVLGQRSTSMARHYSESAQMPERTRGVVQRLKFVREREAK